MSALFERLQTLAFMNEDYGSRPKNKTMSKAISTPQLVSQSLHSNKKSGEPKKNLQPKALKQASLAFGGTVSRKRISKRILEMRELERAKVVLRPIKSVDDWHLNVKSRTKPPNSSDAVSSTDSWDMSTDHESTVEPIVHMQHEKSPSPHGATLVKLDEDNVVEIPGEWEEGDGNRWYPIDEQGKEESCTWCYCCLSPWIEKTECENSSSSELRSMQTLPSIPTMTNSTTRTTASWKLNIMASGNSDSRTWQSNEKSHGHKDSKLRVDSLKESNRPEIQLDELSEIEALWTNNPHWVQPEDLCQISSLGVLGRGVEGGVTGVLHIPTCAVHALKSTDHNSEIEKYLLLKKLAGEKQTPQLMGLKGLFVDGSSNKVALVLDYMNLGSLHDHFTSSGNRCNKWQMKHIARETLLGLRTLHCFKTPVLHCDIKPHNILVSSGGSIQIGDFGLLKLLKSPNDKCEAGAGTVKYFSPERHEGSFAMPADIWALGVSLVECLIGRLIEPNKLTHMKIASGASPLDFLEHDEVNENIVDFLRRCLEQKPEKRWDVEMLLGHPLFTTGFLHSEILFAAPKRNEALLKEILQILAAFIQKRVQQVGRASSMGLSQGDNVWSDSKEVSHEDRLANIISVTGYTKEEILKFVDDMYDKQASIA